MSEVEHSASSTMQLSPASLSLSGMSWASTTDNPSAVASWLAVSRAHNIGGESWQGLCLVVKR